MVRKHFGIRTVSPRVILLGGTVTLTTSGAIASQTGAKLSGATVSQTGSEDGRYGVAFDRTYKSILGAHVQMVGPDDTGFPTTTGSDPQTRLLTTSGFSIQAKRVDTQADADSATGTTYSWFALVTL